MHLEVKMIAFGKQRQCAMERIAVLAVSHHVIRKRSQNGSEKSSAKVREIEEMWLSWKKFCGYDYSQGSLISKESGLITTSAVVFSRKQSLMHTGRIFEHEDQTTIYRATILYFDFLRGSIFCIRFADRQGAPGRSGEVSLA